MAKASSVLGMNARDQLYCMLNVSDAKRFGFSKLRAKNFLKKHGVKVAELYATLATPEEVRDFDWRTINGGFAIKPSNGSAGKGVLVIARRKGKLDQWVDVENNLHSIEDLRFHASNILDGQYSTWGSFPNVIVEERIPIHPDLEQYAQLGTPDVRVIVFNNIPVMAMTRLPTRESGGRANLDQGAIGLGIDMGTGKTLYGVSGKKKAISFFPGTNKSVVGIQIPFWIDILKTAVKAANATGLKYMGADIFLHPEKGPMIAEVNAYPGLSIQLANRAGLRWRLQRIEDVHAGNVNQAVKIGQSLFAEHYPPSFAGDTDRTLLAPKERVEIYGDDRQKVVGTALVNTGREWSTIAFDVAQKLGLADKSDVLWTQYVEGEGKEVVVEVKYKLHDKIRTSAMIVSKRLSSQKFMMHLGRRDLAGYLIATEREV